MDGGNLGPGREAVVRRLLELDGQGELRAEQIRSSAWPPMRHDQGNGGVVGECGGFL